MSAALEKAIRDRLAADSTVTTLVPAENIVNRTGRPERFPLILIGQGQEIADDLTLGRNHVRTYATLHIWTREPSTVRVQEITRAVRQALKHGLPPLEYGVMLDLRFESARFLIEDADTQHAVVTFESLIEEAA